MRKLLLTTAGILALLSLSFGINKGSDLGPAEGLFDLYIGAVCVPKSASGEVLAGSLLLYLHAPERSDIYYPMLCLPFKKMFETHRILFESSDERLPKGDLPMAMFGELCYKWISPEGATVLSAVYPLGSEIVRCRDPFWWAIYAPIQVPVNATKNYRLEVTLDNSHLNGYEITGDASPEFSYAYGKLSASYGP